MGSETRRCSQVALLSPVQMGPTRCVPAKNARLSTKGRSPSAPCTASPRSARPCAAAHACLCGRARARREAVRAGPGSGAPAAGPRLGGGVVVERAVQVVQAAVLHGAMVQAVLVHGDLRAPDRREHGGRREDRPQGARLARRRPGRGRASGPLNTLGSFMSFQTYRCGVEPWYAPSWNCCAHQPRAAGLSMSRYADAPGQHHLRARAGQG